MKLFSSSLRFHVLAAARRCSRAGTLLALATPVLVAASACDSDVNTAATSAVTGEDASEDATLSADTSDVATAPDVYDQAKVFLTDPTTDNRVTKLVTLAHPTDPEGFLKGEFASVVNCLQQDGGAPLVFSGFEVGNLCVEAATAARDPDGSYLSIEPPKDDAEAGDKFAELMMYYHVNQIHDFFHDGFDLSLKVNPIEAVVNLTINSSINIGGGTGWQGFPNAAFMPPEAFTAYGLPKKKDGAIVFGQTDSIDFSYDASVIYHEYVHAMIGTTRLNGVLADLYGLDNLPGAMNEGFADYFSCSRRDDPIIGAYALAGSGAAYVRDLTDSRKCPDDITTEVHADGKIIGSCMWEIRQALGQQQADMIILSALQSFTSSTNLQGAGKLIQSEAKKVDPAIGTQVGDILKKHGVLGCERAKEWANFSAQTSTEGVPYAISGTDQIGSGAGLKDGVPGYIQFYVDVPAGKKGVTLSWVARSGGGGMMGGGGTPDVQLAIKKGSAVVLGNEIMADAIVQGKAAGKLGKSGVSVTLSDACLPTGGGRIYVMMLNKAESGDVTQTAIDILTETTGAPNLVTCK